MTTIFLIPFIDAYPTLYLTVTTHQPTYYIGDTVYAYGNLTLDSSLITDGLVGLEIDTPIHTLLVRTLVTNTTPTENWLVEVLDVIPCDQYGKPKNIFQTKKLAHFNTTIKNNDIEVRLVLVTVSLYDHTNAPLGVSSFEGAVKENTTVSVILSVPIPTTAANGTAITCSNAFSGWPKNGGKPYCPEKSKTFQITGGVVLEPSPINPELIKGNYNTTFKLSFCESLGIYTISVSSMYQGLPVVNSTTFEVKIQGDATGDGAVDAKDLRALMQSWPPAPYDPNCDFNGDTVIDGKDLRILGTNWGYGTY